MNTTRLFLNRSAVEMVQTFSPLLYFLTGLSFLISLIYSDFIFSCYLHFVAKPNRCQHL